MKPKVIVYKPISPEVISFIEQFCHVVQFHEINPFSNPAFLQELEETEGLLGSGLKVDKELLGFAPRLKIVSNYSAGYNNLDIEELSKRGIYATNAPNVLSDTTADTVMALILASARRVPELDRYVKEGKWRQEIGEELFGVDVHHKVLGIIGLGKIGSAIAKRASLGFDMKVIYHNRKRNLEAEEMYNAKYYALEELLRESDFICLMTPLTDETRGLINLNHFKMMKRTAIFINCSRGDTVVEKDLIYALEQKYILGAGLDVYVQEPIDQDHPLLKFDNVITLPHIGSATKETRLAMQRLAAENLVKGICGEVPPNLINESYFKSNK